MANQVLGDIVMCINLLVRFYGVTMHTNETSLKDLKVRRVLQKKKFQLRFFFVSLHLELKRLLKDSISRWTQQVTLKHETQLGSAGQRLNIIKILGQ